MTGRLVRVFGAAAAVCAIGALAGGASAAARPSRARARSTEVFSATIRSGPDRGLALAGILSGRIARSGRITGKVTEVGLIVPLTGQVSGHLVKLEFRLPNGQVLTGVSAARTHVGRFKRLPARGLFLGPRAGDVGDWAVTTGRISTSSIILATPPTGPIIEPSGGGSCAVMGVVLGDGSAISGGSVMVTAAALVGDQCPTPYRPPPASFTLNGKTYPLMPDGVLASTMMPGDFVAFYEGSAPEPSGNPSCVGVSAAAGGVQAKDTTVNPDFTSSTTTTFSVCQQ